jgi:hypothetical protein
MQNCVVVGEELNVMKCGREKRECQASANEKLEGKGPGEIPGLVRVGTIGEARAF